MSKPPSKRGRLRDDASDQKIGDKLRARRLLIGMTQEKLGDALGVSFQQVQKYEKGANRISASRLRQIAVALEVPVTHFYDAADKPAQEGEEERLECALARIENALVRERLVDLAKDLAKRDRE